MKTTLKRGIGRGAAANGNGRAVFPPAIAPSMRRYRQPLKGHRGALATFGKVLLWVVVVALMLSSGALGGFYLYVEEDIAGGLEAKSFDVKLAQKKLDAVIPGEATTALILGYDKRIGKEAAETGHSDTLMLLRADPDLETVTLLSFPRDLLVEIRGCRNRGPFVSRINNAYGECGSQAALETVRNLTGVPIHYLVTVNFRGFTKIVANLGGVWMDVDRRYFNDNSSGGDRYAAIDLKPGYQKLSGQKALDFVRFRHTDSDLYRLARQQLFVKAVKERLAHFSALDLPRLVKVITSTAEVGRGRGEFNARTVLGYALFAYDLPSGHFFHSRIDVGCYQGFAELTVAESCVQDAVRDFVQPDVEAPAKATAVALNRKLATKGPAPRNTSVMVLNGNGRPGAAATANQQLDSLGYKMIYAATGDANAPSFRYYDTQVYYEGTPDALAAARRLAKLFPTTRVEPLPAEIAPLANGALVTVVVGQTYHGQISAAPADRTPTRQPARVSRDGTSASVLKPLVRRVPFRLYTPTVLATGTRLETLMPVRLYRVEGHRAVRLTYSNGVGDFYGIQQTDWDDAPALADPNEVTTIKGRRYRLYYSGPNLHMVVVEMPDSNVWVINTLLDKLSNETMLSIARSLRPMPRR
jgi:LCP family protein required for cell wall assembly